MDIISWYLYQLGKEIGKTISATELGDLRQAWQALALGEVEIFPRPGGQPLIRLFNCPGCPTGLNANMVCAPAGIMAGSLENLWRQPVEVWENGGLAAGEGCCEMAVAVSPEERARFQFPAVDDPKRLEAARTVTHSLLAIKPTSRAGAGKPGRRKSTGGLKLPAFTITDVLGVSPAIATVKKMAEKAAHSDFTVLIQGESGTGKELLAHAIHHMSWRAGGPFVTVNCAAIPENLLEAEFFGYEEGSFTGAKKGGKPGKIELANGGTLLLDEIGDMPLSIQAKLLRVIQFGEIEKLGSVQRLGVDVRFIAATNRQLDRMVAEKTFREDLFYRLNVISLHIPPLRERPEDILILVEHILSNLNQTDPDNYKTITPAALASLQQYAWPGNVRELENTVERAFSLLDTPVIDAKDLMALLPPPLSGHPEPAGSLKDSLAEIERELVLEALEAAGGNRSKAAKILGLSRSTFHLKLKQHNIE